MSSAYTTAVCNEHKIHVGSVFTSDKFYDDRLSEKIRLLSNYGILAVDMETAELYTLAAGFNVQALTIMTVSDSLITHEKTSAEERQTSFDSTIKIALEII